MEHNKKPNSGGGENISNHDAKSPVIPNKPPLPLNPPDNNINHPDSGQKPTAVCNYKVDPKDAFWNRWASISQIILAFLTFATIITYVCIYIHQSFMTRDAIAEASIANMYTKEAIKKTERGIRQSEKSFAYSVRSDSQNAILAIKDTLARERNTKRELRAYLSINGIPGPIVLRNTLRWNFIKINTGKTPAYRVRGYSAYNVGSKGLGDVANSFFNPINRPMLEQLQANGIGDTLFVINDNPEWITDKNFNNIYKGRDTLFILTFITYYDVFGDKHYTRSCFYTTGGRGSTTVTTQYWKYNDAN